LPLPTRAIVLGAFDLPREFLVLYDDAAMCILQLVATNSQDDEDDAMEESARPLG
jgi:hypothetical protein